MKKPLVVEAQSLSRAIADVQEALADALPAWIARITDADESLRRWALARRTYAQRIELAWWAAERGEWEPWDSIWNVRPGETKRGT